MALHIDLGTNVDAAWTDKIAVSTDAGQTWDVINALDVSEISQKRVKDGVKTATTGTTHYTEKVTLRNGSRIVLQFDVKDVANQAGWNVGGIAGINQAVDDITTWCS